MSSLPDINFWLALTFSAHPHHKVALNWFDGLKSDASCSFCRMTQQGFLRLASNPKAFLSDALTLPEAWKAYDLLMSDERVDFQTEPPAVEREWRRYTGKATFSAKIWNDAYLAAFAKTASMEMVTFDRGFRRYTGLRLVLLTA